MAFRELHMGCIVISRMEMFGIHLHKVDFNRLLLFGRGAALRSGQAEERASRVLHQDALDLLRAVSDSQDGRRIGVLQQVAGYFWVIGILRCGRIFYGDAQGVSVLLEGVPTAVRNLELGQDAVLIFQLQCAAVGRHLVREGILFQEGLRRNHK